MGRQAYLLSALLCLYGPDTALVQRDIQLAAVRWMLRMKAEGLGAKGTCPPGTLTVANSHL